MAVADDRELGRKFTDTWSVGHWDHFLVSCAGTEWTSGGPGKGNPHWVCVLGSAALPREPVAAPTGQTADQWQHQLGTSSPRSVLMRNPKASGWVAHSAPAAWAATGPGQGCARGSRVGGDPGGDGSTVTGLVWIGGTHVGRPSEVLKMPAAACASGSPGPGFSGRGLGRKPFTHVPCATRKSCQLCACGRWPLCLPLLAGGSAGPGPSGPRPRSLALPPGSVLHGEPPTPVLVVEMLVWGAFGQDLLFWMLPSD